MFAVRTILAGAASLAALASLPAAAGTAAALEWKDLDLSTEAGRSELDRRIDTAAAQACQGRTVTGTLIARAPTNSCLKEARAQFQSKIAARTRASAAQVATTAGGAPQSR